MILVEPQTPEGVKALEKSNISQILRPIILFIQTHKLLNIILVEPHIDIKVKVISPIFII